MVAEIVALLMFVGPDIKEHRIQPEGMAQCLRHTRIAERHYKAGIHYKCIKSKEELATTLDGSKSIKALKIE